MAKAQDQAKAAAEVPQDVTETLPEEVEQQISLLPEETAAAPEPGKQEEVEEQISLLPEETTAVVCTLDRNQPYGEVFGAGGIAFEQDGKYFDRSGNQISEAEA